MAWRAGSSVGVRGRQMALVDEREQTVMFGEIGVILASYREMVVTGWRWAVVRAKQ
jgi:hypothetical protein